jgi:hypothetical protein
VAGTTTDNMSDVFQRARNSLAPTEFGYALSEIVGCFNIFSTPSVTDQMPFWSQLINSLSASMVFVYFLFLVLHFAVSR